jgi:16S rRNA (cytidine1402-2'-O)-methyltransferase
MGTLFLVATPIGNLEDLSRRAVRVLREVKLIAAEDTRHSGILLKHFDIPTPLTSYFEHNKLTKLDIILAALADGDVALISDAGTPAVNDPGYELVRAALASGFEVRPVPGPCSPIAALSVSGLPPDAFLYLGYLPHKRSERQKLITQIAHLHYTLIFLESPHRLIKSLEDLLDLLGDRPICVAREMTKLFEEFWRGPISGALAHFKSQPVRGEFTLVVGGNPNMGRGRWTETEMLAAVKQELKNGRSAREISAELAEQGGWSRKEVYALVNQGK